MGCVRRAYLMDGPGSSGDKLAFASIEVCQLLTDAFVHGAGGAGPNRLLQQHRSGLLRPQRHAQLMGEDIGGAERQQSQNSAAAAQPCCHLGHRAIAAGGD